MQTDNLQVLHSLHEQPSPLLFDSTLEAHRSTLSYVRETKDMTKSPPLRDSAVIQTSLEQLESLEE